MKSLALAALCLLVAASSRAKEKDDPKDDGADVESFISTTPASGRVTDAAAPVLLAAPAAGAPAGATRASKPGEGALSEAERGKAQTVTKAAAAAKPTLTEAAAPQGKAPIVFQHFKDLPFSTIGTLHKKAEFGAGPGATVSVGFEAVDGGGGFRWAEERSTERCRYFGWYSLVPGGPAIVDDFPKSHNFCKVESGVLGESYWSTAAPKQQNIGSCHLKDGQRYYFNLQLTEWQPSLEDSKFFACDEYLGVMGDAGGDLWHQ